MHPRVGEVREAARVVEVEMREHDVLDVARVVPELTDLVDRGEGRFETGAGGLPEDRAEPARVGDVTGAEAGVDQKQSAAGDHEQAVGDQRGAAEGCIGAQSR